MSADLAALCYLVAGALFILALRGLSNPETSRRGNQFGMIGMAIAIATTLAAHPPAGLSAWAMVIAGMALGGGAGAVIARRVPMTSMPELVAAFHSLVGMAAVLVAAGALYAPAAKPTTTNVQAPKPDGGCEASVVAIAIAMPIMPNRLPRRLVSGFDRPRSARMKRTPATR